MGSLVYLYRACAIAKRDDVKILLTELVRTSEHRAFYLTIRWNEIENKNSSASVFLKIMPLTVSMEATKIEYICQKKILIPIVTITTTKEEITVINRKDDYDLLGGTPTYITFEEYIKVIASNDVFGCSGAPITEQKLETIFSDPQILSLLAITLFKKYLCLDNILHGLKLMGLEHSYKGKGPEIARILTNCQEEIASEQLRNELDICYDCNIQDYVNRTGRSGLYICDDKSPLEVIAIPNGVGFSEILEKKYIIRPLCIIEKKERKNYVIIFKEKKLIVETNIDEEIWSNSNQTVIPKYLIMKMKVFDSRNTAESVVTRLIRDMSTKKIRREIHFDT